MEGSVHDTGKEATDKGGRVHRSSRLQEAQPARGRRVRSRPDIF
eukprot:COSAG06_NODE_56569_length_284_cov_0.789189_1_plen_43_part_10